MHFAPKRHHGGSQENTGHESDGPIYQSCLGLLKDSSTVSILRKDFKEVKKVCASNQQQCLLTECSDSQQALVSSLSCEYKTRLIHLQ